MSKIPQRVLDRLIKQTIKFQRILKKAFDSDINESDTVTIISDMLSEIFGFDKYSEITSEYAIKSTFCDLAVKINNEVKFLIEAKSISTDLKEVHLRQAVDYSAHEGIQWIILTNGIIWRVFNVTLKKAIDYEKIFELDFLNINPKTYKDQELLFLLAKEGFNKDAIDDYHEHVKIVNKHFISAIILEQPVIESIKKELRRFNPGLKVDASEIETILRNDVLKRNVIEEFEFIEIQKQIKRAISKRATKNSEQKND